MSPKFNVHLMPETETPIQVDPGRINLSFLALPIIFQKRVDGAFIDQLQQQCQPRLWASVKALQPDLPSSILAIMGNEIDPTATLDVLSTVIDLERHSVVLNVVVLSFDGGKTNTRIFVGFCYPDQQPQVILPRNDQMLPTLQGGGRGPEETLKVENKKKWWQFGKVSKPVAASPTAARTSVNKVKICPDCNTENDENALRCKRCGKRFF
jgi:ribosomal protein L40E